MERIGCNDDKCVFGNCGNPGTNSGCKCLNGVKGETRRNLRSKILWLKMERDLLADEVKHLRKMKEYYCDHKDLCPVCLYEGEECELHKTLSEYNSKFGT